MGQSGSARTEPDGLAGGPRGFTGMAPIPNPADLTRAERVRFYGHKYDYLPEPKGTSAGAFGGAPRFQLVTRRKADGTLQISMRPIANPEDMSAAERRRVYGNRYAPRAVAAAPRRTWRAAPVAAARPAVVRTAPAPVVKPAPRPVAVAPLAPAAPVPAIQPAPAPARPTLTPVQQLQAAVSAPINRGASLSVPADLKAGKEADVVLSLPGDLLAMVQEQAAKLGLGKAAKKVNAYANLKGQGYAINPPGQQTAPVAAGKPTTFTWKVKPTEGEKTPLKADYGLELNGAKPKAAFSVGSLEEAVAAPVEAAKTAARGFKLPSFKMPALSLKALAFPWAPEPTIPGVGKIARENVVGGALALLALILLVVLARGAGASRARAERRRKFRTMQDYGVNEPDHDAHAADHTANHGYVNPMIAAAAGAAGGYALASHGHDDHGHGHDDHGHGHDDHAHGHDDHGHGHDDHGHGGHDDHGHGAAHTSHDAHGHDDHGHDDHGHGHGHDDHGHGHDDHGHGGHDGHAGDGHGHDDHGHGAHTALASHGHDDHGHGEHEDHGHGDHGHDDGHGGHGDGHDDHGHGPAQHISHGGHDAHGQGHDDHGHGHDDHGHGHDDHGHGHGHDDHGHGHDDGHGHDAHHPEPEHAH